MNAPVRITFDSNVWRPLVSPAIFPNDADAEHFQVIRQAIQQRTAAGYLSETTFTLEAIQKTGRKAFFGGLILKSKLTVEEQLDGSVHAGMVFGPDPSHHANNNPYLSSHLEDAHTLNFKLLKCPRIGGVINPDLQPSIFALDDHTPINERLARFFDCGRKIEERGCGIQHIKDIGNKYSNGKSWVKGLKVAPETEDGIIAKAVAEWADGDAVAAHYGYGNDYFCTRDNAKSAGAASVLSQPNQAWLSQEYKIQIVSPEFLAKALTA